MNIEHNISRTRDKIYELRSQSNPWISESDEDEDKNDKVKIEKARLQNTLQTYIDTRVVNLKQIVNSLSSEKALKIIDWFYVLFKLNDAKTDDQLIECEEALFNFEMKYYDVEDPPK